MRQAVKAWRHGKDVCDFYVFSEFTLAKQHKGPTFLMPHHTLATADLSPKVNSHEAAEEVECPLGKMGSCQNLLRISPAGKPPNESFEHFALGYITEQSIISMLISGAPFSAPPFLSHFFLILQSLCVSSGLSVWWFLGCYLHRQRKCTPMQLTLRASLCIFQENLRASPWLLAFSHQGEISSLPPPPPRLLSLSWVGDSA